jgi:hypothetical protein
VGLEKTSSADELLATFRQFQDEFGLGPDRVGVIQAAVEGDDYCLGALFRHGQLAAHMAYKNLATYPAKGGFGVLRETVPSEKLAELAQQLLGPLKWNGVAELDYRWDGKDSTQPKLIEVNTRFWGGLFQSVESGIDFPWLLYQLTVFDCIDPPPPAKIGVRTQIPIVSLLSHLQESLDEESSLERMKASLTEGWQRILSGNVWRGLKKIAGGVGDALDPSERLKRVQRWFEETQHAKSELLATDDPLAALGMLYVVGSLVRNGKLPEEFARSGEGEAVHEPHDTIGNESPGAASSQAPVLKKR